MVSKAASNRDESPRRPPATTPEVRESQMIAEAVNLAERQLREGTASAQVISHYLKLGSTRERLEQERLRHENELLKAKAKQIDQQEKLIELYEGALTAMRTYQGAPPPELEEEFYYEN